MKTLLTIIKHYIIGVLLTIVVILLLYLLEYLQTGVVTYAECTNFWTVCSFTGIPFGFVVYALNNLTNNK
jgi:hypothetical protein